MTTSDEMRDSSTQAPYSFSESPAFSGIHAAPNTIFISGAGPAGLAAALTIAKAGGRAIVFERQGDVGGRFHGDFQGIENWSTPQDVLEEFETMGIDASFEARPFRAGLILDAEGRDYRCSSDSPIFFLVRRGHEPGTLD